MTSKEFIIPCSLSTKEFKVALKTALELNNNNSLKNTFTTDNLFFPIGEVKSDYFRLRNKYWYMKRTSYICSGKVVSIGNQSFVTGKVRISNWTIVGLLLAGLVALVLGLFFLNYGFPIKYLPFLLVPFSIIVSLNYYIAIARTKNEFFRYTSFIRQVINQA